MSKKWISAGGVILAAFAQTELISAQPAQDSSPQSAITVMGPGGGTSLVSSSGNWHTMTHQGGPDEALPLLNRLTRSPCRAQ